MKLEQVIKKKIKECKSIKQLHQLHAHTITSHGFLSHIPALSISHFLSNLLHAFISLLSTTSHHSHSNSLLSYSLCVFNSIPSSSQTTFSFNNIIRAHTLLSSPLSSLLLFRRMRSLLPPDFHTFTFVINACSHSLPFLSLTLSLSLAQSLHSLSFKLGFLPDLFIHNALLHFYSVSGCLDHAHRLFSQTSHWDVVSYNSLLHGFVKAGQIALAHQLFDTMPMRDATSWGTVISGYAQTGNQQSEAIRLFNHMLSLRLRPDNVAIVSALSACAQLGELEQGVMIHDYIKSNRIPLDSFLLTGLVDLYAKCGCVDIAKDIFDSSSTSRKNLYTWNAMLVGLALHGYGHLALDYFFRMVEARIQPDGISFLGVLAGCSHAGLVGEAQKLFNEMEAVYGVARELKHYGCMSDLLGRAGLIEEAEEMIKGMPMGGDVFVWGGLLGGCNIHGDLKTAEKAARQVMMVKPDDGGVYSVMANIYAKAERWEDVVNVRRSMSSSKRVKKNLATSSFIQS